MTHRQIERYLAIGFGVFFVVALLALAVFFPTPSAFQYTVFRTVLALAAAGVASMIPGFLEIQWGNLVRAGGALGVFVVLYFLSPAQLVSEPPKRSVSFEGSNYEAFFAIKSSFEGQVVVDSASLLVDITRAEITFPIAPPAGPHRYIQNIRVGIAHFVGGQSWDFLAQSNTYDVNTPIGAGDTIRLPRFQLKIPTGPPPADGDYWLAFSIGERLQATDPVLGLSHVHTRCRFF